MDSNINPAVVDGNNGMKRALQTIIGGQGTTNPVGTVVATGAVSETPEIDTTIAEAAAAVAN